MPTISPAADGRARRRRTRPCRVSPSTRSSSAPAGRRRPGAVREDVLDGAAGHPADQVAGRGVAGRQVRRRGPAVLEHGDPVADLADLLQPVRDVDDRDALRGQLPDDPEQVAHLVVGEHRARLVHDDQPGLVGERPGHADDLLAGRRQRAGPSGRAGSRRARAGPGSARVRRAIWPRRTKPSRRGSWPRKAFSATDRSSTRSSSW